VEAAKAKARQDYATPSLNMNFNETMKSLSQELQKSLAPSVHPEDGREILEE
jgi:hypothetical protein